MAAFYCSEPDCRQRWKNVQRKEKAPRCRSCRETMTALKRVPKGVGVYVLPDFPEHYNFSMGRRVKNRAHHRQLQRELGCQDWEPVNNSPGSQLSQQAAERRARVMVNLSR